MKEMFFKSVEFREVQHLAFSDEYITAYVSVNHVPKIYLSVNTPRDEYGFVKVNQSVTLEWGLENGSPNERLLRNILVKNK